MLSDKRALGFKDVLIRPEWSLIKSRQDVSLERKFKFKNGTERIFTPIIASNIRQIGTIETAKVLSRYHMLTCMNKNVTLKEWDHWLDKYDPDVMSYVIPTVGLDQEDTVGELYDRKKPGQFDIICLDVANGYMNSFINYANKISGKFPEFVFMAGNVATLEGAKALADVGVDIVKVGIGSGSVCTTRYKTGVGVPQITAIDDTFNTEAFICSDGGCTNPGDVAKAFVAGADFVMLGGLLAGTRETGSVLQGSAYTPSRDGRYKTSEGKRVDLQEPVQSLDERLQDILGGLRSTGSYIGQPFIKDFGKAELIQVTEQTNDWLGPPD